MMLTFIQRYGNGGQISRSKVAGRRVSLRQTCTNARWAVRSARCGLRHRHPAGWEVRCVMQCHAQRDVLYAGAGMRIRARPRVRPGHAGRPARRSWAGRARTGQLQAGGHRAATQHAARACARYWLAVHEQPDERECKREDHWMRDTEKIRQRLSRGGGRAWM